MLQLVSPWCIDLPFPCRFPSRHVFQDAIHSPSSHGCSNISCYYISTGTSSRLDQRASAILLVMISYLPVSAAPVPMYEFASPRCLTCNTVSSTSEIARLAFSMVCLDSLNIDPTRVPPSRTKILCSSLSKLVVWQILGVLSSFWWRVKLMFYPFYLGVSKWSVYAYSRVMYHVRAVFLGVSGPLLVLVTSVTSLVWFRMCRAEGHRSLGGVRDCLVSGHTLKLDLDHVSQSPIQHLCTS